MRSPLGGRSQRSSSGLVSGKTLRANFLPAGSHGSVFIAPVHTTASLCVAACSVHCCPLSASSVCSCLADGGEIPQLRERYLRHKLFADCHVYDIICEKSGETFKWQITGVAKDAMWE